MIYDHKCTVCGHMQEVFCSVAERETPDECEKCGSPTEYVFTVPKFHFSFKGGAPSRYPMVNHFINKKIPIMDRDGNVVGHKREPVVWESANDRAEYMKKNGLVEAEAPEAESRTMYDTMADGINEEPGFVKDALDSGAYKSKFVTEQEVNA